MIEKLIGSHTTKNLWANTYEKLRELPNSFEWLLNAKNHNANQVEAIGILSNIITHNSIKVYKTIVESHTTKNIHGLHIQKIEKIA